VFPQAGLIRTDKTDYFIEPLERGQQEKEASGRTHVVYRQEAIQQEWAEPHEDLHNEGKLWAGAHNFVHISVITSGLKLSVPDPSVLICKIGPGHTELLYSREAKMDLRGSYNWLEAQPARRTLMSWTVVLWAPAILGGSELLLKVVSELRQKVEWL
jgi:hypothetical protein